MIFANTLIGICWFIVVVVWLIYGIGAGTYNKERGPKPGSWIRFLLFAAFISFLAVRDLRELNGVHVFSPGYLLQGIGVFLCVAGVSFAIWARAQIGGHWGLPMSRNKNSALVTAGPYSIVRHPIYTGLCVAMAGSMITAGLLFFVWYLIWMIYFIYSAVQEEKLMLLQFPNEYLQYKKETKMLIPFLF